MNKDELNKELLLDLFYSNNGDLDKINKLIDAKFRSHPTRKISIFEKYIQSRVKLNPKVLNMSNFEISPSEVVYLSQHPDLRVLEVLDLRKNGFGDMGLDAIAHSTVFKNLRVLDLRNTGITRVGMESLLRSKTLTKLEKLDLRLNKFARSWEEKIRKDGNFPNLTDLRIT